MNDGEENILTEAHRYSRQAEEAVKKGHWQQAIDKHSRAAQNFQACVGLTSHPAGDKVLQQLAEFHLESAERVRARLQPQPIRPHFAPQPPLLIHLPVTTSIEFASQEEFGESVLESSKTESDIEASISHLSPPFTNNKSVIEVQYSPTVINIQVQSIVNPIMTAKAQTHIQHLDSLLSQLSLACQSDVDKEFVSSLVSEMRSEVSGLRDSFSDVRPIPPIASGPSANESRLAEQVAALERQLAAEVLIRRQQQHKLDNAEIVIEKHKKRWKLLKEAAKKKDGDSRDPQSS